MQPIGDSINPPDESGPNATGFKGVMDATGVERSLSGAVGPGGAMPWVPPPLFGGGIATALPTRAAAPDSIAAAPAAPVGATPGASTAAGLTTVLVKIDALIAAIKAESGFLEKVLS